jgi:signal transduction histidine kinase/HAMP domain-containing protein
VRFRSLSLGAKLNLSLLAFLLVLGAATSAVIVYGFSRTQDNATERSRAALEEQGKLALQAVVGGASEQGGLQFESVAEIGRRSARYLESVDRGETAAVYDTSGLARTAAGLYYNPDPNRTSDLVILNGKLPDDEAVQSDLAFSAALDTIFPVLHEGFAGAVGGENLDPIAIVFISTNSASRYYPPVGIHEALPANVEISARMEALGPANNPERLTIWTAPYEDTAGQGQIVTARTPVYDGGTFRGSLEVDLSIEKLIDQINSLQPTPGGFAFYVDSAGSLWQSDAFALLSQELTGNAQLASLVDEMKVNAGEFNVVVEKLVLAGEEFYIAYAPLLGLGGSFAVAAPVSDITAEAAAITAGIEEEGTRTFQVTLVAMGALFVAGLVGASYLNRRVLVTPIQQLAAATRAVAAGDMETKVTLDRSDELGTLGGSFNSMVEQLRESERMLEQRVEDRTRELAALLEVSRAVASTLDTRALMGVILDQLNTIVDHTGSAILTLVDGELEIVDARAVGSEREIGIRIPLEPPTALWNAINSGEAIIIDDVRSDEPTARDYRTIITSAGLWDLPPFQVMRSWMAVPLVQRDQVIGMLTISHAVAAYFKPEHARLARAFADQAAIAMANSRLFAETQLRAKETEALFRADAELFRSLDLDAVLQALVDVTVNIIGADTSMVATWSATEPLRLRTAPRQPPESVAEVAAVLESLRPQRERALSAGVIVMEGIESAHPLLQPVWEREGIQAVIEVPIMSSAGVLLGAFTVTYTTPHVFSPEERRLLMALAERAAVAIQNAELYERAQLAASLEERQRLARELHDSVSQALYGIALGARTARTLLDRNPADAVEPVEYISSLAEAGLTEMRALIFELRPESLETEGLVAAISKQAAALQARHGLAVECDLRSEPQLPLPTKETLYRITQEALHNTVKHAKATSASVVLEVSDGEISVIIQDDGAGFNPDGDFPGHLGLRSMKERAVKSGGTLSIESAPGSGTRVQATFAVSRHSAK